MRFFEQVYVLVRHVPPGRVVSYGQIARMLGQPHAARTVGWALRSLPSGRAIPWHRVVNASGAISIPRPESARKQRRLLESEGVTFGPDGRIDMGRFGWEGLPEPAVRALIAAEEVRDEPA